MTHRIHALPVLVLSPHSRCNCRCVMCDIWKDTMKAEISHEQLTAHLRDIERLRVKWVVFSGGEPLMHSDLFRLSDLLRARGIRVTLLSTGLLLARYAEAVTSRTDDLIVSLDGPPAIHDQIRRVPGAAARLANGLQELHNRTQTYPIAARCTIQKANHSHIVETARFAYAIGLNSLSFLAADLTSEAFNRSEPWGVDRQSQIALSVAEIATLTSQFNALLKEFGDSAFITESKEKFERIIRHFKAHLGLCEPVAPRCNAPWVSAVVAADGTVRPCFFHKPIGSIRNHGLEEAINSFEAQAFRAALDVASNPICKRCVCSLHLAPT